MSEHTTAKLARALSAVPAIPKEMVQRAVDGYYHDFLSPLDFPEMQLVDDLRAVAVARLMDKPRLRPVASRFILAA